MFRRIRRMKLHAFFLLILFLVISFLLVMEALTQYVVYNKYNQYLNEKNEQILITYANYLEDIFNRMENLTYSMIGDVYLQDNLTFLRDNVGADGYYLVQSGVKSRLYSYIDQEEYFESFALITKNYNYYFGKRVKENPTYVEYIEKASEAQGKALLFSQEQSLILVREIRKSEQLDFSNLGYIVAQIDFDSIMHNMEKTLNHLDMNINMAIFDKDICIYSKSEELNAYKNAENGWYIDGQNFVSVYTFRDRGYTMVLSTCYKEVEDTIRQMRQKSFAFSTIVALIAFFLSSCWVKQVINDWHFLIEKMDEFGAGKLPDKEEAEKYISMPNEIGKMYRHFYQMAEDYTKLTDDYYTSKLLLKEAEYSQLQKQIQPHFFFNTLSIVSWMAYSHKDMEIVTIVEALGRMMRGFSQKDNPMISVQNDMQMVEDYLYIQQFRFKNRLKSTISLSEETKSMKIPRLSIQPLVENSVTYAMNEMISECVIHIFDRCTEDAVEIVVEDNGPGFSEKLFDEMKDGKNKTRGNGIALININKRLQYAFSEEYGLQFKRLDNGMQVIIRIPKNMKEERDENEI